MLIRMLHIKLILKIAYQIYNNDCVVFQKSPQIDLLPLILLTLLILLWNVSFPKQSLYFVILKTLLQ